MLSSRILNSKIMFIVSKDKLDNYEIDRCLINDNYRIQYYDTNAKQYFNNLDNTNSSKLFDHQIFKNNRMENPFIKAVFIGYRYGQFNIDFLPDVILKVNKKHETESDFFYITEWLTIKNSTKMHKEADFIEIWKKIPYWWFVHVVIFSPRISII